ncbi:Zn-ribbon domain-containing OB-fold protein [Streptomyces sp. NPDC056660]|uniref:Zn-ribbon domain-containing OB-fold protein n=1 Tax=Streptomyces sp. NPDC056660 TaxID=3345897 RepID=UPI0036941EC2
MTTDAMTSPSDTPVSDWLLADELAPAMTGTLAPLYEAAATGVLALPFCGDCGTPLELEQDLCDRCPSGSVVWRQVEPVGVVHAVTTVHRREPGLTRPSDRPYHVIDAELVCGHRLVLTTDRPTDVPPAIADPVRIGFRTVGGTVLPAVALTTVRAAPDAEVHGAPDAEVPAELDDPETT